MVNIRHHVSDDLILAHATGALNEATSLLVATHMALCPACRRAAEIGESIGGALLEGEEGLAVSESELEAVPGRIGEMEAPTVPQRTARRGRGIVLLQPLRNYAGGDLDAIRWKSLGGVRHMPLDTGKSDARARLLNIPAGQKIPDHGHRGLGLTLVLSGSFFDQGAWFRRGDLEEADATVEHHPVAGPEETCICLAVTDAPLRFRGVIPRMIQPFAGI